MKKIAIILNEKVARWAKAWAARHNSSVSKLASRLLQEKMLQEKGYDLAMKQYLSVKPKVINRGGKYPSRDELYES